LRKKYPGLPIVAYVNTSAEVKAEADICCTSANAVDIVEAIAEFHYVDTVIMVPDEYLARNVARQTYVNIIAWQGHCEGTQALFGRRCPRATRRQSRPRGACASGMPAGGYRRSRLRRLDVRDDLLCGGTTPEAGRAPDGVLHERQCRSGISRCVLRAAV